ncbi:UNVERIFIED_CONTAM: hypothetical protein K2H54_012976 [Gekko kuhli]
MAAAAAAPPPESPAGAATKRSLWERLRQGRLASWWRAVLLDYAEACREVGRAARRRPGRAAACAGLAAGAAGLARGCPDEASLEAALLEAAARLLLLPPATRSAEAEGHVARLLELRARGRLRVRGLGLAAVAYEAPRDADAALYRARCRHLAPPWWALPPAPILDLGLAGRWWLLRARMQDCDVNADEFRALPEPLRRLHARTHLRSHTNERLFEEKFRPAAPLGPQHLGPEQHQDHEPEEQPARHG